MRKRKTIEIPDGPIDAPKSDVPLIARGVRGDDERDTSKPIAYDENGNPLYAPRGFTFWLRWPC
jgi:hypothetical protein